nr:MAG TPA: hypothetical protein [Caudoviricetes sp.]
MLIDNTSHRQPHMDMDLFQSEDFLPSPSIALFRVLDHLLFPFLLWLLPQLL